MVAKQVRAAYTQEFSLDAVRLVQSGQPQIQLRQMLGIPKACLGILVRRNTQAFPRLGYMGRKKKAPALWARAEKRSRRNSDAPAERP